MNLPSNPSQSTLLRNPELYPYAKAFLGQLEAQSPKRKRTRQPTKALNKTEARYRDILVGQGLKVLEQAIRLKLADNTTLLPDLAVMLNGVLTFYEVKGGFIREDAWVKLKVAAHLYPEFDFVMAQWKNNQWKITSIPK